MQFDKMLRYTLLCVFVTILRVDADPKPTKEWWKSSFIYQIYPRSFMDSDGDGVGDLNGITSKLEHFTDLNVSAVWLSPIFESPMVDFGYDISNFTNVDPIFGSLNDFTNLTTKAKALGLKVLLDFVPNHSSDKHPWFLNSIKKLKPYDDYYIWMDGKLVNGTTQPPNNWLSVFGGPAWTFNKQRGQYYLHQFAAGQPDLNFRNPAVNREMEKILTFWMNRGVDGFRIDAINFMFEDPRYLDEPKKINPEDDDYESLLHIYTKDQSDTFTILKAWRDVADAHSKKTNGERKILLTEAYAPLSDMAKYYEAGADVPMNFMFIDSLNKYSTTIDIKQKIDAWMNVIPHGHVANWVLGNHDNSRVSSRYGLRRADGLSMLMAVLPGIGIIYYGDEIGMVDRNMTWNETVDPQGRNMGPERYHLRTRDPERTPFQWDCTKNAGFSQADKTWLPVNENYNELNLERQTKASTSHYNIHKKLATMHRSPIIESGTMEVFLLREDVLGVVRKLPDATPVVLLINFSEKTIVMDAKTSMNIPDHLTVYVSSTESNISWNAEMDTKKINLPGEASVILHGP